MRSEFSDDVILARGSYELRLVFLTDGFPPEVSQDWDQVMTNGFLHRVPGGLLTLHALIIPLFSYFIAIFKGLHPSERFKMVKTVNNCRK